MPSITFSKPFQWVRLEALLGRFWPLGLIFDTPVLKCCGFRSEGSLFSFPVLRFFQVLFFFFFCFLKLLVSQRYAQGVFWLLLEYQGSP